MSEPNYVRGGLRALLKILQEATPANQPTEPVLKTFLELLTIAEAPTESQINETLGRIHELEERISRQETRSNIQEQRSNQRSMRDLRAMRRG